MTAARDRWYRQPVAWLAAGILFATIAGCIGLIILSARHPDQPLQLDGEAVLRVPVAREPQRPP